MKLYHAILTLSVHSIKIASLGFVNALATETAGLAKARLQESLSSPAKKLTLSPEIIITEPTDPTALLLQSTEVTKLSNTVRVKAKANAAFIAGSINAVKTFCTEQETSRGNFPSPLPVIYCDSSFGKEGEATLAELADAGVSGLLYPLLDGSEISAVEDIKTDNSMKTSFESALQAGIQLIPEVTIKPGTQWDEAQTDDLILEIEQICGSKPAAVLLSIGEVQQEEEGEDEENDAANEKQDLVLPKVSKELCKSMPILGSIRTTAGGGRMGAAVSKFKDAGFTGVILRCDCLPGYRINPDLEFVGGFWGAAISDLKSTKSKNFNFRSKVELDKDIPLAWYNYQKNIMESGALGSPEGGGADPLDAENGDHVGF